MSCLRKQFVPGLGLQRSVRTVPGRLKMCFLFEKTEMPCQSQEMVFDHQTMRQNRWHLSFHRRPQAKSTPI